jgi:hypothetical protein
VFGAEVLRLFAELEHGARRGEGFKKGERRLMSLLDLNAEWWAGVSVCRDEAPPQPPGYWSRDVAWPRVRAVRRQLLAAIGPAA